mmetsp:Transcript_10360/g.11824  ORF Transcript_10360/g.11824 Transcript_10360/m.11824 type:complete len:165 (+) Transcript_10360:906-1400(+)
MVGLLLRRRHGPAAIGGIGERRGNSGGDPGTAGRLFGPRPGVVREMQVPGVGRSRSDAGYGIRTAIAQDRRTKQHAPTSGSTNTPVLGDLSESLAGHRRTIVFESQFCTRGRRKSGCHQQIGRTTHRQDRRPGFQKRQNKCLDPNSQRTKKKQWPTKTYYRLYK